MNLPKNNRLIHLPLKALLLLLIAVCSSCSLGEGEFLDSARSVIYVCGQYNLRACYWKVDDGHSVRVDLTTPLGTATEAKSLFMDGDDVYVAGYYYYAINKPCYWKNGQFIDLYPPSANGECKANSIYVHNGTPYIAGYYYSSGIYNACYWVRNNPPIVLASGASGTQVLAILAEGNNIHAVYTNPGANLYYWKNGSSTPILSGMTSFDTARMVFRDNSLHIGILYKNGTYFIQYWINGTLFPWIESDAGPKPIGFDLYRGDIHISYTDSSNRGVQWSRSSQIASQLGLPSPSCASAIKHAGSSRYIAGAHTNNYIPYLSKDGVVIPLDNMGSAVVTINDIALGPKSSLSE